MLCYDYYFMFIMLFTNFGDWGLGIGDWAQSPIPNPQSPNIEINNNLVIYF